MKAFLFDMDGTMIDNMMVHHTAWQQHLSDLGLEMTLEEVMEKIHGVNQEILKNLFGDKYSDEERKELAFQKEEKYRTVFKGKVELLAGLQTFLDAAKAKNIPMAIGTAAPKGNVDFVFSEIDIAPYFKGVVHAGDVENGKPHPEVFLKAAKLIDIDPSECIVFEDSPTGAKAAANAGAKTVVILTTHKESDFENIENIIKFIPNYEQLTIEELIKH